MNNIETNFMNFEDLTKLIEEHKKETYPYKTYKFDSTSYTLLLIDINKLLNENKELKRTINESTKMIDECACYNEKDKECKCNFSSMAMTTLRKILKGEITSYHEDKRCQNEYRRNSI